MKKILIYIIIGLSLFILIGSLSLSLYFKNKKIQDLKVELEKKEKELNAIQQYQSDSKKIKTAIDNIKIGETTYETFNNVNDVFNNFWLPN